MSSIAYYRLPNAEHFIRLEQTQGEPEVLTRLTDLNGREGFVMAPFTVDAAHPIVLMHPDKVQEEKINESDPCSCQRDGQLANAARQEERLAYGRDFRQFHQALKAERFDKLVLARCEEVERCDDANAESLFLAACRCYPRQAIVLVCTPMTGTWLMATPEVLLSGDGERWRTMALAGTMKLNDDESQPVMSNQLAGNNLLVGGRAWSDKNRQEQRCVATYIQQCLAPFATHVEERGPYTVQAGNLVHLRTDFTFELRDPNQLGTLLEVLHPTPAVCGLPKEEAHRFILQNEHIHRSYYSGFVGLLNPKGETHLYVSLRCMQISNRSYRFYAGGGLLADSVEQQEWEETVAKMETMKKVVASPPAPPQREGE